MSDVFELVLELVDLLLLLYVDVELDPDVLFALAALNALLFLNAVFVL